MTSRLVLIVAVAIAGNAYARDAATKEKPGIDALAGKDSPAQVGGPNGEMRSVRRLAGP